MKLQTVITGSAAATILLLGMMSGLWALEIPIDGAASSSAVGAPSGAIAYVDIERVFNEHPMKKRLQEEFTADIGKRRSEITQREQDIAAMEKVVVSSTTEVERIKSEIVILEQNLAAAATPQLTAPLIWDTTSQAVISSGTVPSSSSPLEQRRAAVAAKEAEISRMQKDIQTKKEELDAAIRKNKEELVAFEKKQTSRVLSDIYGLLDAIAREENVRVILDKSDVLYGQADQDLTGKVIERLQGR